MIMKRIFITITVMFVIIILGLCFSVSAITLMDGNALGGTYSLISFVIALCIILSYGRSNPPKSFKQVLTLFLILTGVAFVGLLILVPSDWLSLFPFLFYPLGGLIFSLIAKKSDCKSKVNDTSDKQMTTSILIDLGFAALYLIEVFLISFILDSWTLRLVISGLISVIVVIRLMLLMFYKRMI